MAKNLVMRLIQKYLPNPRHTEVYRIFVKADPETAWNTARHLDMSEVRFIKLLFAIRTLPDRFKGQLKDDDKGLGIDQITENGNGFFIAGERAGSEIVVASAGKFWHLNIPFASLTPEEFIEFNTPGFGKLAWNISVDPFLDGSTIAIELRTTATDELSWKKLKRYYHFIGIGSRLIRKSMMHRLEHRLGKVERPDFRKRILPGDDHLKQSKYQLSHTVDIEAPPGLVWSYLMQMGCDRGGWYSIDALDNGNKPSIDNLENKWPDRKKGEKLWATPKADGFFEVYSVQKEKHFVIGGESVKLGGPFKMTWAFVLEPIGSDATQLITRVRMEASPPFAEWLTGSIIAPPIHSIMQKAQLKHFKAICERDAQLRKFTTYEYV